MGGDLQHGERPQLELSKTSEGQSGSVRQLGVSAQQLPGRRGHHDGPGR